MHPMTLSTAGGAGQLSFPWVPPPTATEIARGVAERLKLKARRATQKAKALIRSKKGKLRQADWLDPADYANEMIEQHRREFARDDMLDKLGAFYVEFAERMKLMLLACALKIKRWVGITWKKVYNKLVAAPKKYGDPELVAVKRGKVRVHCTSLTGADDEDLDPSVVGADVASGIDDDGMPTTWNDVDGSARDKCDDAAARWLDEHDPEMARSERTAERRRAEQRELDEAMARSAERCQQLAGRSTAGDEP